MTSDGDASRVDRVLATEVPVALEFNGIGYAVLMATPADLLDLTYGFALGERLIDAATDILDTAIETISAGWIVRVALAPRAAHRIYDRVRHRTSDSACGLCGVESLEQALRPLPRVPPWTGDPAAMFTAAAALAAQQPLGRATRAVHGAARCAPDGTILAVREDVGRHNAFDKLIGAMLRTGEEWNGGFALLSSRCSYELVEKAALSGCPMLATISAPTDLAVRRAREAGLTLHVVVRADALLSAQ
ncbi:formate dehydrogenase accessory sulfurtransferase FdhD [Sphingomonas sp.]|uniref:formate dehydrogenase accessory sulfurtransferase FdhD n=1 Tax=Sphingomonas sp. TaxID=28214 RepID=UPI0025E5A23E|nr:formate dehydrogenase accessory sulfurtransferase FdhD [Sphingomonas sp.]